MQNEEIQERNDNNAVNRSHDGSLNESDGYETAAEETDDEHESNEYTEKTVDRMEDNVDTPQDAENAPQTGHHMQLRNWQNVDYALFSKRRVKQLVQKVKKVTKKVSKKYKVKVRDMF